MAVKGIKDTENVTVEALCAMLKKWLGPQLSIINEQLTRIEARVDRDE